jgi:hypothetical protein
MSAIKPLRFYAETASMLPHLEKPELDETIARLLT